MKITNEITELAGKYGQTYFGAGSIDIVGGDSRRATQAANSILASLGQATNIAKETALTTGVAAAASYAALGTLDPTALGIAAMVGISSSISKGGKGRGSSDA